MRQRRRSLNSQGVWTRFVAWRDKHRRVVFGLLAVLVLILIFQVFYPSDRALPLARLGGDQVGVASYEDIVRKLQLEYAKTSVTTTIRGKKTTVKLPVSGIVPDNTQILTGVSEYPWYLKIIPLSSFIKGALTDQPVSATIDKTRFIVYSSERAIECTVAPKNAGVVVKDGTVQLDPAKDGQTCAQGSLEKQLTAKPLTKQGITTTIETTPVKPKRSDKDVQPLLDEARDVTNNQLILSVAGKSYDVDKKTIGSWLAFPEDTKTNEIKVGINDEAVKAYLETIQKDVYIAPGVTVITTKDGIETSRVPGRSGQGIDLAKTTEAIKTQVLVGDGTVTAALAALPPTLSYNRSYSKTPEGLQALVNDLVKGKDMAISVRKLGDTGVHANGDKQYHPASTYKLFVAYSALKRIDSGQFSWGQTTSGGQTFSQCFDNMIVNSDNACAEWFGATIGWSSVTADARGMGASRTTLNRPFVSTANDQALFLQKLESNQLGLSEPSRARLIEAMKRQVFRKGIPAGVGVSVADKVGFLEGLLHDSAIVYAPSGVYVLVIYSDNSSWGAMADAAKQIHAQLQ